MEKFSESTGGLVVTFCKAAKASGRQQQLEKVESQPESLDQRVMRLVKDMPLTKARISAQLGQKKISGQLNKIIRFLVREGVLEYTIPDKPNSRLQKCRLTEKGKAVLHRGKG